MESMVDIECSYKVVTLVGDNDNNIGSEDDVDHKLKVILIKWNKDVFPPAPSMFFKLKLFSKIEDRQTLIG